MNHIHQLNDVNSHAKPNVLVLKIWYKFWDTYIILLGRTTVGAPLRRATPYTPLDGNLCGITRICGESIYTQILIQRCIDRALQFTPHKEKNGEKKKRKLSGGAIAQKLGNTTASSLINIFFLHSHPALQYSISAWESSSFPKIITIDPSTLSAQLYSISPPKAPDTRLQICAISILNPDFKIPFHTSAISRYFSRREGPIRGSRVSDLVLLVGSSRIF
ncbi:hypothetical protein TorRG33x02_003900 [Trema orientale]|uniref:Uncharacterized protein n=1 Tax=Trema orientale TaxID=63057 RepID=A0A2P5G230_TREOI|nr:hypothetical protein TorRG33x02_003900 [Trema orientale]